MEITADDLRQLVSRLSPAERVRLAHLALAQDDARQGRSDREAYRARPVGADEFSTDAPDPLAWESEGWDGIQ